MYLLRWLVGVGAEARSGISDLSCIAMVRAADLQLYYRLKHILSLAFLLCQAS